MNKSNYVNDIINKLNSYYSNGTRFTAETCFHNGCQVTGIVVQSADRSVPVVVYPDDLPSRTSAAKAAEIMGEKIDAMMTSPYKVPKPKERISRKEKVLGTVVLRIASTKAGRRLAGDIASFKSADMIGFFYLSDSDSYVSRALLEELSISMNELKTSACKNTLAQYNIILANTTEFAPGLPEGVILQSEPFSSVTIKPHNTYLLTNDLPEHGAELILIPPVLETLAKMAGSDYYIVPVSTAGVLIARKDDTSAAQLKKMLRLENRERTLADQYLSDNIYLYDSRDKKLIMVQE